MFARFFHVKIRAAEKALDQGRIDDAFTAAVADPALRTHPRAQRLLEELTRALLSRARLHRQAGRYPQALVDLERVAQLQPAHPDIQTLRQRITRQMDLGAAESAAQREAAARAAERLRAGRLDTGRLDIARVDDTRQRAALHEELAQRVERGTALLDQAREALERDDFVVAVRFWQDARDRYGHTRDADTVAARLVTAGRILLERWYQEGRLERILAAQSGIGALVIHDPTFAEQERVVTLCARAADQLGTADYDALRRTLLRIKAAAGEAPWLAEALGALAKVAEGHELLLASPLGLLASSPGAAQAPPRVHAPPAAARGPASAANVSPPAAQPDPPRLLLVDGGGSSLLVQGDRLRIGRAGTSAPIDVPMPADVESHHADIIRRGDDYFLTAYGLTEVNQRPVQRALTLLRDGDRIVFGNRARMVFCRPSPMSTSAVCRLSHRARLAQDVSDIILFQDTCLIGPDSHCHVRTRGVDGRVVLFTQHGQLLARQTQGPQHLGRPAEVVAMGRTLDFGDIRLTVKPYDAGPAGAVGSA